MSTSPPRTPTAHHVTGRTADGPTAAQEGTELGDGSRGAPHAQ
ncbi:hypothetical protein [Streptomyces misionensis]|nr:hypothetical protein [Streptomyces misionensis]